MKFSAVVLAALATVAMASPARLEKKQVPYLPCTGAYGSAQCCATDVLGLANLDCGNPPGVPESGENFSEICAAIGQRARCCLLPILDQGILCAAPNGVVE